MTGTFERLTRPERFHDDRRNGGRGWMFLSILLGILAALGLTDHLVIPESKASEIAHMVKWLFYALGGPAAAAVVLRYFFGQHK